jgi:rhodanese-related sulfurtransferase
MRTCGSILVVLAAGLAIGGSVSACADRVTATTAAAPMTPGASGTPHRVEVAQFAAVIAEPSVQIIDVRTPAEFADGHIVGAVNIPVNDPDFGRRVSELDPGGRYAVYCRSGNRSQPAVAQMQAAGILDIVELESGTNGWAAAGQPLTR